MRFRAEAESGLLDRSSRPHRTPSKTSAEREDAVIAARAEFKCGPARLSRATGVPERTISRILTRRGLPPLAACDPVTGALIRASRSTAVRYERQRPGELIHVDVKKLGRIPDGGGWRAHGRSEQVRGRGIGEEHGNTAFRDAADNTPQRQDAQELPLQPRANWQTTDSHDVEQLQLRSILLGIDKYHRRHADDILPLVQDLAEGQNPDTLFVACVDSRVNPNLITSSGPGDLLTLRNIGNVVCNAREDASIESTLSFALTGLGIESIVICGHSNCGAMKAVLADGETGADSLGLGEAFNSWLDHSRPSGQALLDGHPVAVAAAGEGYGRVDQLGMVNVALQLRKLEDHPLAGPALAAGQLQATGLFFDIATARVILVTTDGIQQLDGAAPLSRAVTVN